MYVFFIRFNELDVSKNQTKKYEKDDSLLFLALVEDIQHALGEIGRQTEWSGTIKKRIHRSARQNQTCLGVKHFLLLCYCTHIITYISEQAPKDIDKHKLIQVRTTLASVRTTGLSLGHQIVHFVELEKQKSTTMFLKPKPLEPLRIMGILPAGFQLNKLLYLPTTFLLGQCTAPFTISKCFEQYSSSMYSNIFIKMNNLGIGDETFMLSKNIFLGFPAIEDSRCSNNQNCCRLKESGSNVSKSRSMIRYSDNNIPLSQPKQESSVQESHARRITPEIEKNRGFLRYRNEQYKNPRKRNRIRFHKAVIRLRGQSRMTSIHESTYRGETTGIKTWLTKSTRMSQ